MCADIRSEDITIQSDVEDIEALREYFQLESVAVLGHSWGGLLAEDSKGKSNRRRAGGRNVVVK